MTMTSNSSPPNWEDAETQPQPPRPNQSATAENSNISSSNNNNNINNNRERPSLDLDKTLPLPADMEAELLESQRVNRRSDNDDDDESNSTNQNSATDKGTTSEESILLAKLQKWTSPLTNNNDTTITETDVAQLLSFASKLHSGQLSWNPTSYRVIQLMVQVAMLSFNANFSNSNMNNNNNSDGGSNSNNVAVASTSTNNNNTAMTAASRMESQYARRLLTDAILPFASLHNSSNSVAVWNAKLIQSIVQCYLVPSVVVSNDTVVSTAAGDSGGEGSSTTAVELLLDHFLARMDADEVGQVVRLNPGHEVCRRFDTNGNNSRNGGDGGGVLARRSDTVDSILDILCSVPTPNGGSNTASLSVRSDATTAIINSLRDLESNDPGRLSRRRLWRNCASGGSSSLVYISSSSNNNSNDNSSNSVEMKECHYTFTDRPTHLIQQAIETLTISQQESDYDTIPPLVYQLGLLPLSVMRHSTMRGMGGGDACVKTAAEKKVENEKQRGMRLRRMCLDGIMSVLDDALLFEDGGATATGSPSDGDLLHSSSKDLFGARDGMNVDTPGQDEKNAQLMQEAWRWARYNSLAHVGAHARSDPEMAKAVLSMLRGEVVSTASLSEDDDATTIAPFRYQRLTPSKLAMGLAVGTAMPRIRTEVLDIIRDLVVEEETIRIKRGRGITGDVVGLGHPWMDCLVKTVQTAGRKSNGLKRLASKDESESERDESGIGHVLSNIIAVADFGAKTESVSGGFGRGLDLLPSLITLGFLCVDSVKRDEIKSSSTNAVPSTCSLAPIMDISSFGNGTKSLTVDTSAAHATASTGRFMLCCLFYQSAASASHYLSSSLTTSHSNSSSSDGGTSVCRNILKTCYDKFCAMAPNSLEHSLLLKDLLNFSPKPFRHVLVNKSDLNDGLMDKQREEIIGLSLATSHLRDIIETLNNLIGGGMNGHVARDVISPAIGRLLLVQATQRQGLGSLWKKTDIEDHIDHAFLLAKKALFSVDIEKRKAAANLLVALLGAATVASSLGRASTWNSVIYEIKGCLRRCLTQHQSSVRMEAYSALIALLPKSVESTMADTQTQDSVSPASNVSPASTVSPLALRSQRGGMSGMVIPPISQNALIRVVSEVLLSSLDRYVTTPQEESHERDARRKRAAQGVGLSQMEVDDDDGKEVLDKSMPLRFENIISKIPQRNVVHGKKGSKKTIPIGQILFNEAMSRINEPLSFLVASCSAAASLSNDNDAQNEMKKAITQLRRRMAACSDVDEYLVWLKTNKQIFDIKDDAKRAEEMAVFKISTLISVAVLAEAMLSTCEFEDTNVVESDNDVESTNQEVEDLFNLRVDAIDRAAEVMSSFITQKAKKGTSKKSKKLKEVDGNSQEESNETKKVAKQTKKDEETCGYTTIKTSDIKAATLARNKKLVEDAVNDLSPCMDKGFLTNSLRRFGANYSKKDEADGIFDGEESTDAATRLYGCSIFRRFLLTKSILLTSGSSLIVTPGVQFSSLDDYELDEKLVTIRLAACFSMGPLLFSEFCAYCYQFDKTSAAPNQTLSSDPSLAQLSLRAFNFCVRGMNFNAPNHPMSRAMRVKALLTISMKMASMRAPASKDGWDFFLALKKETVEIKGVDAPHDALELRKSLLPFLSSLSKFISIEDENEAPYRLCLLTELLLNGMHGEAIECSQLISATASAFSEPNLREELSCAFMRAWELKLPHAGVLGFDFEDVENDESFPLSAVIDVAMQLNHQLDGETHVPLLGSPKNARAARSAMGLPLTAIGNWPEKHSERLQRDFKKGGGVSIIGTVQQLVLALWGQLGIGENFVDEVDSGLTRKHVKLSCVKATIDESDDCAKERAAIGSLISSSIEAGLDNADFAALKMIPHMKGPALDLAQRFVSSMLYSVSKVISTSAPFAENIDSNATFSSSLLKSTKRLYTILVRLILSYMNNPESLASKETKYFLDYITSTFMPRISSLLLALSKQTTTKDGKFIAESKIESHGKLSALLVFEKEKLDNALLKVAAKLKSAGLEEESVWLEEQVVAVHSRDFEIKTDEVENAKAMEAPKKKKAAGSKRKVKPEPLEEDTKKKKKKKKQQAKVEEVDEDEEEDDEEMNDSDAVAEVVGESDDEEEEEEDDDEESDDESDEEEDSDEDNGISLGNLTEEMGSESEEEAEFSD